MAKGKLALNAPLDSFIQQWVLAYGVKELEIQRRHALMAGALDQFHGDPFDRMLIAQAICENMHLVSRDSKLKYYQAPVIWHADRHQAKRGFTLLYHDHGPMSLRSIGLHDKN